MTAKKPKIANGSIKIEHDVPIPTMKQRQKYPIDQMKVGDSFFVADAKPTKFGSIRLHWRLKGIEIMTRSEGTGVRIWRIK